MNNIESGHLYTFDGLDGSGKSELTKALKKTFEAEIVVCPPNWMKPYREYFNTHNVNGRLLYYTFSNWWVDHVVTQKFIHTDGKLVFQDRSWLSTLSEHDYFGAKIFWLNTALKLAKTSIKPTIAFLIHVDNEERSQRLHGRNIINTGDLASLKNDITMENKYIKWIDKLGWQGIIFDNTQHTIESAARILAQKISIKNFQVK